MAAVLATAAVALALEPALSRVTPVHGPGALFPLAVAAAFTWALAAPLVMPVRSATSWLASGVVAASVLGPVIAVGARLAFADALVVTHACFRAGAVWIAASGAAAALERLAGDRGRAHYALLAAMVSLGVPLVDYLAIEPLAAPRLFPADLSPFEWVYRLDPAAGVDAGAWVLPIAVPAALGATAIAAAARIGLGTHGRTP